MKRDFTIVLGVVAVAAILALWMTGARMAQAPTDGVQETGPLTLEARIGQEVRGLGVRLTPLAVLADSRCPVDVQCIQAGTVRVRARLISGLGEADQGFTLGQPVTTETEVVTLIAVLPQPKAGVAIQESEYRFEFTIAKR
ncbi:MAG: hypothetical protein WCT45_00680 [Candidatus Paceibacterota bacterium]|jgi:hypothetical protein